tara:strand:+ start:79 stop:360 length:282 start_codon:yes stop_codon:yes gene_type:complete
MSGYYLETTTPTAWNAFTANTTETADFTVPGAAIGDFVWVSVEATSAELAEVTLKAEVTAADTVTVAAHPDAGTGGFAASAVLRIKVVPKDAI